MRFLAALLAGLSVLAPGYGAWAGSDAARMVDAIKTACLAQAPDYAGQVLKKRSFVYKDIQGSARVRYDQSLLKDEFSFRDLDVPADAIVARCDILGISQINRDGFESVLEETLAELPPILAESVVESKTLPFVRSVFLASMVDERCVSVTMSAIFDDDVDEARWNFGMILVENPPAALPKCGGNA